MLVLVLIAATWLRFYDLSWDAGGLFHPDERQVLIVADRISFPWPPRLSALLTPESLWNPKFFAYGSLPIYLLRLLADIAGRLDPSYANLNSSYVVGRALSALFDVGTVYLIYRLGRKLYDARTGLLAAVFVSLTVLHIQLAHFYAVDTVLTFFVVLTVLLTLNVARHPSLKRGLWLGVVLGMALATKISAAPLAATVALGWLFGVLNRGTDDASAAMGTGLGRKGWWRVLLGLALTGASSLVAFAVCEPYAFIDPVAFLVDIIQENYMVRAIADIPYTRQYIGTLPYLYPIWQTVVWSMGIPLGLAGFGAALLALVHPMVMMGRKRWRRAGELMIVLSWPWVYFALVGSFHTKFLRYMLPVIPFLCLWAAWALMRLLSLRGKWRGLTRALGIVGLVVILGGTTLYACAYLNIYHHEHTWVQATRWICGNVPKGSRIMVEHWDDPLPLQQGVEGLYCYRDKEFTVFRAYAPDDTAKLDDLLGALEQSDYIDISSNRLYNTIPRLPERYPLTSRYYELLLGERLGYELVYYAAVYPELFGVRLVNDTFSDPDLPQPRLLAEREARRCSINLGRADESFTVYDHPKPLVFKKVRQLSREELLVLFGEAAQGLPEPAEED